MLQTSFPKLKKHHPTRLYMLYPMVHSVALVCIEIDKQMPPQGHCPLYIVIIIIIEIQNHFGAQAHSYDAIKI